jgi:chemotaxis-related protein WspB
MDASTLYLLIRLGNDRYAIDAGLVVEVLPLVRLKALPGAPAGAAGIMSYRGDAVPVIDLGIIALGAPTPSRLMTRIVIVRYEQIVHGAGAGLLGLLVPEVIQTLHIDPNRFADAGLATDGAAYLGPVLITDEGVLQQVCVSALLSDDLRNALYRPEVAA